jgi:hypothetical protein
MQELVTVRGCGGHRCSLCVSCTCAREFCRLLMLDVAACLLHNTIRSNALTKGSSSGNNAVDAISCHQRTQCCSSVVRCCTHVAICSLSAIMSKHNDPGRTRSTQYLSYDSIPLCLEQHYKVELWVPAMLQHQALRSRLHWQHTTMYGRIYIVTARCSIKTASAAQLSHAAAKPMHLL